ncbi:conserved hypothetical protein [Leishmania major strain Friedlin]|uniref:Uncharacterized protein n=1 Tax=Leishmania major TaxID=5664 RepID=Q4QF93_LEIMA|nr:conserved hypothetical protein [Leishmania major strain Friedlin]CAG9571474.1 hypothetical_protein_-_conserved [Leishmania major strain Friedlin]CAJ03317.1 conserved hypothetical protein [Leishmania major strain Friedlin]|eukprot:XP_001682005.1 conserved hypothetical protein [Leishmania major strain Friedlin]
MHVSSPQRAKSEASQPPNGSPPLSSSEPAAVHLYDLDTVFLSKTVISLTDVFTNSTDGPFDLSPLCAPQQQGVEEQQRLQQAAATTASSPSTGDAHCSPSSGATHAHMCSTSLPFSGGSTLRPKAVARGADGQWRTVSTDRGAPASSAFTTACNKPPSQEAHARMLLVPLDSYHFLLTYHDVDVAGQLRGRCDKQTAMATMERLSAASPGCRPPRSGICVVRRLEGEQRGATKASSAATAVLAGAASATRPTLSRIAHGLPLDAFDGWVRDYTVYGLSCNEAVLRAAWEDKARERAEGTLAMPAGAVVEVGESAAPGHESAGGGGSGEERRVTGGGNSRGDNVGGVHISVPPASGSSAEATVEGAAALAPQLSDAPSVLVPTDGAAVGEGKDAATFASPDAARAAMLSPSLDRLHCSSTTSSSSTATPTPSPPTERSEEGGKVGGTVSTTMSASPASTAAQQQQQQNDVLWEEERQRTQRAAAQLRHRFLVSDSAQHALWALEVHLPAMKVRAVSPAEFYALEVEESDEEEVPAAARHSEDDGNDGDHEASATRCAAETREDPADAPPPGLALPRRKTTSAITRGRAAVSGHRDSVKGTPGTDASRPRSPSPADPLATADTDEADHRGDSRPDGSDARRSSTSVATHHAGASCSTRRCGRSASSASPSLAMVKAMPTPLIGGARGFVDGHFSVARFNSPGSLCWRIDEDDEDDSEKDVAGGGSESGDAIDHAVAAASEANHELGGRARTRHGRVDPVSYLRRRRRCTVLFISDMGNCAIRYANFHNRLVRTITGVDGVPGYRDGSCVSSLLRGATALAWCSAGLLFTDGANNVVRLVTNIRKRGSGESTTEESAGIPLARSATRATKSEVQRPGELEVHHETSAATEQPRCVGDKPAGDSLDTCLATATESQDGAVRELPPTPPSSGSRTPTREGALPSSTWKRDGPAAAMPRVWTLAGCTRTTDADQHAHADASLASYVDCAVPSRARFGYISDMALWTDETGDTQVLLVDQTHHALRILDVHGGVSTYVGPLDYEVTSMASPSTTSTPAADSLPLGLVFPCCLTVSALIKERSPALLSAAATTAAATMITPQPYLCSSSPLLFTASAITGAVSVLLPISQRSAQTPWNVHENQHRLKAAETREGDGTCNGGHDDASMFATIRGALELGVATEGRRIIGEAAAPSLKHVVVGWAADEADGDGVESARAARRLLRVASAQQASQYLRLRFPWLLPPSVQQLSTRLVAGCTCHVSGKRRGAAAAAPAAARNAVGLPCNTGSDRQGVGASSGVPPNCTKRERGGVATATSTSQQRRRVLFQSPPRHPPIMTPRCPPAQTDAAVAAAAKELGALLLEPALLSATPPRMVEVLDTHLGVGGDGVAAGDPEALYASRSSPPRAVSPRSSDIDPNIEEGEGGSRRSSTSSNPLQPEGNEEEEQKAVGGDVGGGRAAAKWLAPPLKSVSRSPSGSRSGGQQQPIDPATSPLAPPSLTYAGRFQEWTPEQRQQRLRSTQEIPISTTSVRRSPCGSPCALHKQQQQQQQQGEEDDGSPSQLCQSAARGPPPLSSSRPRGERAASPNNLSGRGSPPLTPRAMVAHQLMQRRRTSRSSTAPHAASVEGGARGSIKCKRTAAAEVYDDISPIAQAPQQPEGSQGRAAPVEPLAMPAVPDRHLLQLYCADRLLHDAYDAAVRRLFRVYSYLATKIVTTTTTTTRSAAPSAAGVGGSAEPRIAAVGSRRGRAPSPWATHRPRQVEQYTMSFAAFFRFVVLTGYADYLAEVAVAAVTAAATGAPGKDSAGAHAEARASSSPSPVSLMCRLSQVQQRRGGSSCGAGTRRWSSASASPPTAPPGAATAVTSSTSPSRHPTPSDVLVVPLATTDARAIAAVLYACGVRQKGYHTLTQMDFQSFRRAALLLHTWTRTATCAEAARMSGTADDDGVHSGRCSAHRQASRRNGTDAAAFAYVDTVPSLDALTSEEVVVAYAAVYERAVRCIPALAMSFAADGTSREEEANRNVAEARDEARQRSAVSRQGRPASSMRTSDRAPSLLVAVGTGSPGATSSHPSSSEAAMGGSHHSGGGAGGKAAGVDEAVTPPVSPIATAGAADDLSCFALDGGDVAILFPPGGLTPHETLALDELLRLLQRNESTLRQLFEAYSVPITVHRSPQYEAPSSAAAATSSPSSLLTSSPELSLVLGDGGTAVARQPRHTSGKPLASVHVDASPGAARHPVVAHRNRQSAARARAKSSAMAAAATAVAPLDVVHDSTDLSGVSARQQDVSWKVQQLYTMSAVENKEAYERTSRVLRVMPFKLFVDLWRTLDVFPSLMGTGAMQQVFGDALTTPLLRGLTSSPGNTSGALLQAQEQPPRPSCTRSDVLPSRRTVELLCAHGGLPYACFVESFVRVALVVFSHTVDRIAYPTATAKTAGLMQWCNKQVTLGLVAKRVQQQLRVLVAGGRGSSRRASMAPSAAAAAASASCATRAVGVFPDQLRLFRVPTAPKASTAPPGTG